MTTAITDDVEVAEVAPRPPSRVPVGERALSLGTMLVMAADLVVLGAIVAAYLAVKQGVADWPPDRVVVGTYIPTVVTVTAALSSFSAQWALYAARRNDPRNVATGLALTTFFGLAMFLAELQALDVDFGVSSHPYGTFYFLLLGYHLAHLVAVLPILGLVAGRALAGHFPPGRVDAIRASGILWHATTVIWYVVVTVLFLLSRHA